MSRRGPRTAASSSALTARLGFGMPIEALWLAMIVLVPLTFGPPGWFAFFDVPKVALMRTLAALILAAWTLDVALGVAARGLPAAAGWRERAIGWLNAYPPRWTLAVAAAIAFIAASSTLTSAIPSTALWGLQQGSEGRSLLSTAVLLAVFFAIAVRLCSERMAWRLVAAIALATAAAAGYIVVQGFDLDPFELARFHPSGLVGSFGNPIFAGAALLMGLPIVLAGALAAAEWRSPRISLTVGAVAAGTAAAAMGLTFARGPWVGAAVAMVIFLAIGWRVLPPHLRRRLVVLVGVSLAVAIGLLIVIDDPRGGGRSLTGAAGRAASIPGDAVGGLSGRAQIWKASFEVAVSRPWFVFEDGPPVATSHLLGYGPDSFAYVYPLREEPSLNEILTLTRDAHNQHINMLVEQGVLGLAVSLALTLVPLATGGYVFVRRSTAYPWRTRLLLLAVLSALAGRAVEQLVGVDKLTDTLLSWALLGLLVSLPVPGTPADAAPSGNGVASLRRRLAAVSVAAGALVLLATVTMTQAINPLLAARDAVLSDQARARSDGFVALDHMTSATDRAPGVARYRLMAVALMDEVRGLGVPPDQRAALVLSTLAVLQEGLNRTPLSPQLNQQLALHYLALAKEGISDGEPLAIEAFQRITELLPSHWQPKRNLGVVLLDAGRPAEALPLLSEVVETLGDAAPADGVRQLLEVARREAERAAQG